MSWDTDEPSERGIDGIERMRLVRDDINTRVQHLLAELDILTRRKADSLMASKPSVLFVCVHNAGRSQMAAGFLTHLAGDAIEASDVVITMGCGDTCPVFPGVSYRDWVLEDPAGKGVESVHPIRDEIKARIEELIAELLPARLS